MTASPLSSDAGFTLIELLVVLLLLGFLGSLLAGSLQTTSQSWHWIVDRDAADLQVDAVRGLLRRLLSQCAPELMGDASHRAVRFTGGATRVAFLGPLAQRFGAEDVVAYELHFDTPEMLHLGWRLDHAGPTSVTGAETEVLSRVTDGAFLFFGPDGDGKNPQWWDSWAGRNVLPQLVRVRFRWRGRFEELDVAPLLTATTCPPDLSDPACSD